MSDGWIGVDFDGTLALYSPWDAHDILGPPIQPMLNRVKRWLAEGFAVKIVTARVGALRNKESEIIRSRKAIEEWCLKHVGRVLEVTCSKDYGMIELWDDRCVQVEYNTGRRMDGEKE